MAVYAIGDIQGCFIAFKRLLKKIEFNPSKDTLWLCGDLVNRGKDSLKTLQYIRSLGSSVRCVLGNHDLHLLAVYYTEATLKNSDTLSEVLVSPDVEDIMVWLRQQSLFYYDMELNTAMVHAGIYPGWTVKDCIAYATEVENCLRGDNYKHFLQKMYGNQPDHWDADLTGMDRLRFITNVFTRMRYVTKQGAIQLKAKGSPSLNTDEDIVPWFEKAKKRIKHNRVVFGHWSTLPSQQYKNCFALDSGCLWGGELTALRIDKRTPKWFRVECG